MITKKYNQKEFRLILNTLDDLVPANHIVRKYEDAIDWTFIYPLVENLYSPIGKPSIDPIVLFKLVMLNYLEGIHSMRKTCERCKTDVAYRWFLGINFDEKIPDHSTFSQNLSRKFTDTKLFDEIFNKIISDAYEYNLIDPDNVFGDSTHVKANANKKKHIDKVVKITEKIYKEDLLRDINADRINHDKKPIKDDDNDDTPNSNNTIDDDTLTKEANNDEIIENNDGTFTTYDAETGEIKVQNSNIKFKHIKVSTTDADSGFYHKGEHEKIFAYSASALCDSHGFILATYITSGNIHDSISFKSLYHNFKSSPFFKFTNTFVLDNGYIAPYIAKTIIDDNKSLITPYVRPKTKDGFFKKYEYVYDEKLDVFICPNNRELIYKNTTKDGYREFISNPHDCIKCPLKSKCTKSKSNTKIITQHVWFNYLEKATDMRYSLGAKEIYNKRKETIERIFGDGKENFGLRFTRYKGITRVTQSLLLTFACMNLKKMARLRSFISSLFAFFPMFFRFKKHILTFSS